MGRTSGRREGKVGGNGEWLMIMSCGIRETNND